MATGQPSSREQKIRTSLNDVIRTLEQVESVISVAISALRHQNCEKDQDVAYVLQRSACDRISLEIDRIAVLMTEFDTAKSKRSPKD